MSTVKTGLQHLERTDRSVASTAWLWVMLGVGFLIRLAFMGQSGFANDVSSFEAWSMNLVVHPPWQFYGTTSFADYPPGYFYILWVVGHVFALVSGAHPNYDILKYFVKLPAVLADLGDAALSFAIVRRFANERWALTAAAFVVFNPAIIFISASWGQVDSISSGLALLAAFLLMRSDDFDERGATYNIVGAWLAIAYSLLIKPQAAVLVPIFLAFAFVNRDRMRLRLVATGIGIAGAAILIVLLSLPFHPKADVLSWLYHQYSFGKDVYPFNSVNAFNLWTIKNEFWMPDSTTLLGLPQYIWGVVLLVFSVVLTVVRYLQSRTDRSLLEAGAIASLAFFMLSTRMHERYIYEGLLFTIAAVPLARRYGIATIIFTFTLFVNLFYSMYYLAAVTNSIPGTNPHDLWPPYTHILSFVNVATFFVLGFMYLGQTDETADEALAAHAAQRAQPATRVTDEMPAVFKARSWFDPREGLGSMAWLDHLMAAGLGLASFVVSFVNYWYPADKIFDEIYFARAGEEYLKGLYIYENTHPPLTKLIITASMMLFGGLQHGDNSHGWRFFDVLFGAIAVWLIYVFAKRLTRSTLFASFASIIFIADGMHFAQSRIATPEGIVIVFSLGTLYAFYRFWIASQSIVRAYERAARSGIAISAAGAIILGVLCAIPTMLLGNPNQGPTVVAPPDWITPISWVVVTFYYALGFYLLLRLWIVPRFLREHGTEASYADGSVLYQGVNDNAFIAATGAIVKKNFDVIEDEARVSYRRDGTVEYATPAGSATYSPGKVTDDEGEVEEGRHATGWLIAFSVLLGALVASKWYGVMAYGVSFIVIAFVWLQRFRRIGQIKRWGNPNGVRLDVAIASIAFLSASIYICAWIPDLTRHVHPPGNTGVATVNELIYRQNTMYEYHHNLRATHPYESPFWSWPLDLRPIAYYWKDSRGTLMNDPKACCVAEIISLPNPLTLWFGLLCVPLVGLLAYREKNKGYALLFIAYLMQWLPWALSPRLIWIYHFYTDVPLIILCNVIILQRAWNYFKDEDAEARTMTRVAVGVYVAAVVGAFVFFYPVVAGIPLPWDQWHSRMWLGNSWV